MNISSSLISSGRIPKVTVLSSYPLSINFLALFSGSLMELEPNIKRTSEPDTTTFASMKFI